MKTLRECQAIVEKSKHFKQVTHNIDNHEIIIFDYNDGAKYLDFLEHDAFELRGLTFVDGERFPMLDKFFNLGEKSETELEESLTKKVKSVQIKDDGSLIGFIVLRNGKVVPKTKAGFSNPFTTIASNWLKENQNEKAIKELYDEGIHPLFECVSDKEKIVLKYDWEGLKLIQARRKDNSFLTVEELQVIADKYDFVFEAPKDYSIQELLDLKDTFQDIEGFIVRFEDDTFTKVKTAWYFEQHQSDEGLKRVNYLLESFLNGENKAEETYEEDFLKEVNEKVLKPFSITSLNELKAFVFRDGERNDVMKYQQAFKGFLTEYNLQNNYDNENTLIKLSLDNSIDDILPQLDAFQRSKAESIQEKTLNHIDKSVRNIISILEKNISHKEINEQFKGTDFLGVALRNNNKEYTEEKIREEIVTMFKKNTRKLQDARAFLR